MQPLLHSRCQNAPATEADTNEIHIIPSSIIIPPVIVGNDVPVSYIGAYNCIGVRHEYIHGLEAFDVQSAEWLL